MAAVTRIVLLGSAVYRDATGAVRRGRAGQEIEVHADDVERFDRLNVLPSPEADGSPEQTPEASEPEHEGAKPTTRKTTRKTAVEE